MIRDVLIIGGGPAGMTAGLYAARAGLDALLVESALPGGQAATTNHIENYPGFPSGIGGPELMMQFMDQAQHAGLSIAYQTLAAISLAEDEKRAEAEGGDAIRARAVIIATGVRRRTLDVPGESMLTGRGVSYCATCDGAFHRGRPVAVVGGGNTAAEDALYLTNLCEKVYLIHRRDTLRADHVLAQRLMAHPKIEIIWHTAVSAFEGKQSLEAVTLRNLMDGSNRTVEVSGCFIAAGSVPNNELFKTLLPTDDQGMLIAGPDTRTAVPRVYVAGDIRSGALRQIVSAAADGAMAATMAQRDLAES